MHYYVARIPNLEPKTIKECAIKFREKLHRIGVTVFTGFIETASEEAIKMCLSDIKRRNNFLICLDRNEINYGYDYKCFIEYGNTFEFIELESNKYFVGSL